ncbi:MAG: hypothetical protein V4850_24485 [Myxococcota bacterium]
MSPSIGSLAAIVFACACHGPGEDEIFGTYVGFLRDAELDPGITVEERDTSFTLTLEPGEDGVSGVATLRGKTRGPLGVFDGKEITEISDVNIDGDELWCTYKRAGFGLAVNGTFGQGFSELDLDVAYVGVLFLDRQDEPAG